MIGFHDIEELKKKTEIFFVSYTNKFAKKDIVYIKKHETYGIIIKEPASQDGFYQVIVIAKDKNGNVEYPYLLLDEKEIELANLDDGSLKQLAFIFSTKNKEEFNKYWKRHGFKSKTFKVGDKVTKFDIHLATSQAAAINAMVKI